MKWARFVGFILIFCIGFSFLNLLQPDQASSRWKSFYQLPPQSLDIVFIGNSHSFNAFNPRVIDQILGTNSFVVGTPGENIVFSYYELKEVLKFQQPQMVALESYVLDLRPEDMITQAHVYNFLDAGRLTENKIGVIAQILFPDHLAGIFPIFRQRMEFNKPYLYLNNLKIWFEELKNPVMEDNTGARINPNVISSVEYDQVFSSQDPGFVEPPAKNLTYLEKFLTLCEKNAVIPSFATAPILQIPERTYDVYAPMDRDVLSKEYGVDIVDFSQYDFNQLHFVNPDHVNAFGSIIISTDMAIKFSEELGVPLDQQALDYYRTYYFDKFDIREFGQDVTLTLYPSDPDAPLRYAWKVTKGDIILLDMDYQSDNTITFPTPEAGNYQIRVEVWNPEGDFVLEGVFLHAVEKE